MQSGSDSKRVLIIEGHPLVAFAMQRLIRRIDASLDVTVCSSALLALQELGRCGWQLVFLAPELPGAVGLSLPRHVGRLGLAARCVLVTRHLNPAWLLEARHAGMLGYINSSLPIEQFDAELRAVIAGNPVRSFGNEAPPATVRLTNRQEEILVLLRGGCSSKQIASRLHISEGTVNNHVATLIRLLGVSNRTQAIARAIELGYLHWRAEY